MHDLLHLCVLRGCEQTQSMSACVRYDASRTSCLVVLLCFDILSKKHHTKALKNTLSVSYSLASSLAHVQMAFTGIKYKGSYCRNKSSSCKQHEIVKRRNKSLPNITAELMSKILKLT